MAEWFDASPGELPALPQGRPMPLKVGPVVGFDFAVTPLQVDLDFVGAGRRAERVADRADLGQPPDPPGTRLTLTQAAYGTVTGSGAGATAVTFTLPGAATAGLAAGLWQVWIFTPADPRLTARAYLSVVAPAGGALTEG